MSSGIIDNVGSILLRLNWYLKRGGVRVVEGKSVTATTMSMVWATAMIWTTACKTADGRKEISKYYSSPLLYYLSWGTWWGSVLNQSIPDMTLLYGYRSIECVKTMPIIEGSAKIIWYLDDLHIKTVDARNVNIRTTIYHIINLQGSKFSVCNQLHLK